MVIDFFFVGEETKNPCGSRCSVVVLKYFARVGAVGMNLFYKKNTQEFYEAQEYLYIDEMSGQVRQGPEGRSALELKAFAEQHKLTLPYPVR